MKLSPFRLILAIVLIIFLSGQVYLIFNTISNKGLDVSALLKTKQIAKNLPKNISIDYDRALFCLPFTIRITDPKITVANDGIHQFTSEHLDLSWKFFDKNRLNLNQWRVTAEDGTLYSEYYPDLIEHVSFTARTKKNTLIIEHLNGTSKDKALSLSLNKSYPTKPKLEIQRVKTPIDRHSIRKSLQSALLAFSQSKNSHLNLDFTNSDTHAFRLDVRLTTDYLKYETLEFQKAHLTGVLSQNNVNIYMLAEDVRYDQEALTLVNSKASVAIDNGSIKHLFFNAEQLKLKTHPGAVSHVYGRLDFTIPETLRCEAYLNYQNNPTQLHLDLPLNNKAIKANLLSYLNPNTLKLPPSNFFVYPSFENTVLRTQLTCLFNRDFTLQTAQGHLSAQNISCESLHLKAFDVAFDYSQDKTLTSKLYARSNQGPLNVNAQIDFERSDYHFGLIGFTNPKEFNAFLPQWWSNIFQNFSYSVDSRSYGDLSLYGNFKNPIPDLLYGSVQATDLTYKGVLVRDAQLKLSTSKLFTHIDIKHANTQTGSIKGDIQLTVKRDGYPLPESVRLDLESDLSLKDTQSLFGKNIKNIIACFESETAPNISLKAAQFNAHYPQHTNKSYYNLYIASNQALRFLNRPLEYLYADVYGRENDHFIRNAEAGLANGQLAFEADITETKTEDPQIRLNAKLSNSHSEQAMAAFFLKEPGTIQAEDSPPQILNLELSTKGALLDIHRHNGKGTMRIDGNNLGQIHLLGPFSKALNELKIPIGSFGLNALESHFQINQNRVDVHTLHINGDQTHIFGEGVYDLKANAIDFDVKIDLLKNARLSFSMLGALGDFINPVTKLLSFKVSGTPQKQIWRSRYDPRNLFN